MYWHPTAEMHSVRRDWRNSMYFKKSGKTIIDLFIIYKVIRSKINSFHSLFDWQKYLICGSIFSIFVVWKNWVCLDWRRRMFGGLRQERTHYICSGWVKQEFQASKWIRVTSGIFFFFFSFLKVASEQIAWKIYAPHHSV